MPPSAIESVTLRPFVARRGLLPTGCRARELDEHQRDAEKREDRARLDLEAAEREAKRPRTLYEWGVDAIAIRHDRLGGDHFIGHFWGGIELWRTDVETVYGFKRMEGLAVPAFSQDGIRSLGPQEVEPVGTRFATEHTQGSAAFFIDLRARFAGLDLGPIDPSRFTSSGYARALELVTEHSDWLAGYGTVHTWRIVHVVQMVVRGLLLRPDLAASLLTAARDGALDELNKPQLLDPALAIAIANERAFEQAQLGPDTRQPHEWELKSKRELRFAAPARPPLPSDPIAALCVKATDGGHVGAGELLDSAGQEEKAK
jgi:hypothetical protein